MQEREFEEAEAETEIAMGAVVIGEETQFVDEVPTAAEAGERRCYRGF